MIAAKKFIQQLKEKANENSLSKILEVMAWGINNNPWVPKCEFQCIFWEEDESTAPEQITWASMD